MDLSISATNLNFLLLAFMWLIPVGLKADRVQKFHCLLAYIEMKMS